MAPAISHGLRRSLAAALIVALALAGFGRALAAVGPAPRGDIVAGVFVPLCHHGAGESPGDPVGHDCCDGCALLALAVLPAPPMLAGPAPAVHYAEHGRALAWAPALARPRGPRLSRGPPAA